MTETNGDNAPIVRQYRRESDLITREIDEAVKSSGGWQPDTFNSNQPLLYQVLKRNYLVDSHTRSRVLREQELSDDDDDEDDDDDIVDDDYQDEWYYGPSDEENNTVDDAADDDGGNDIDTPEYFDKATVNDEDLIETLVDDLKQKLEMIHDKKDLKYLDNLSIESIDISNPATPALVDVPPAREAYSDTNTNKNKFSFTRLIRKLLCCSVDSDSVAP